MAQQVSARPMGRKYVVNLRDYVVARWVLHPFIFYVFSQ